MPPRQRKGEHIGEDGFCRTLKDVERDSDLKEAIEAARLCGQETVRQAVDPSKQCPLEVAFDREHGGS